MHIPRIPPELVDLIIDHLYNDRDTLTRCSFVNRQWRPRARLHLFWRLHVSLDTQKDGELSSNKLVRLSRPEYINDEYIDFVRTLVVRCQTHGSNRHDLQPLLDLPVKCITQLYLETLPSFHTDHIQKMFAKFNTVTYLYLKGCPSFSPGSLRTLLQGLPELEILAMTGCLSSRQTFLGDSKDGLIGKVCKLHTLNVAGSMGPRWAPYLMSWLKANIENIPNLRAIRLYGIRGVPGALKQLLERLMPQLRLLDLTLTVADNVDLGGRLALQNLENIQLETLLVNDWSCKLVHFKGIIDSIKKIESIKEIILTRQNIHMWEDMEDPSRWQSVDEALTSPDFRPKLTRLVVCSTSAVPRRRFDTLVLPKFLAAGGRVDVIARSTVNWRAWKGDFKVDMSKMWGDETYQDFGGKEVFEEFTSYLA